MTILCYHSVDDSWSSTLVIPPDDFARQCRWLSQRKDVLDAAEAAREFSARGKLGGRRTALTFDDGYEALYFHAWPILKRHRLPATVFLVAETLTERGREVDWVDNAPQPPPATLKLDQILEMQEAEVRFESHSYSHRVLPDLTEDECVRDLRQSRELLSDLLKKDVQLLAYPRGRHDERVRRAAETAGYAYAFSLPEAREPVGRYSIPRAGIYPGNGIASLSAKSSTWYMRFRTSGVFPFVRRVVKRNSGGGRAPS